MTVLVHEVAAVPDEVATVIAVVQEERVVSVAAAVAGDVEAALALAGHHPTGEVAVRLRERLRGHIRTLAVPAGRYAALLPESREKDIAAGTVRFALKVARDCGSDPARALRLLAKSVAHLARNADLLRSL
ncbi:hypothetical protein [Streptomyces erythrochromogenes]|uniref:hypothetical protein n=1 Tax=Streptomyces erythrochromogenes TaxID=285574 RepID=UPI0022583760|nr:hypothetical protein [Streptomyces erythrochromogenes]MCX5585544.1 hypothetical protein [Streptomyces erythrochromogenes]